MTAICSVGLDMVAVPGDTPAATLAAMIADEAVIGVMNHKTTAVRVIPAAAGTGAAALPAIRVVDTQVGVLPNSGSAGIYPHLGLGAALLGLAGACAWARRRSA